MVHLPAWPPFFWRSQWSAVCTHMWGANYRGVCAYLWCKAAMTTSALKHRKIRHVVHVMDRTLASMTVDCLASRPSVTLTSIPGTANKTSIMSVWPTASKCVWRLASTYHYWMVHLPAQPLIAAAWSGVESQLSVTLTSTPDTASKTSIISVWPVLAAMCSTDGIQSPFLMCGPRAARIRASPFSRCEISNLTTSVWRLRTAFEMTCGIDPCTGYGTRDRFVLFGLSTTISNFGLTGSAGKTLSRQQVHMKWWVPDLSRSIRDRNIKSMCRSWNRSIEFFSMFSNLQ